MKRTMAIPMNIDDYLAGIRRAAKANMISYARTSYKYFGSRCSGFSHLEFEGDKDPHGFSLDGAVIRTLHPLSKSIIEGIGEDIRFLELGPGAGLASADASRMTCVTRVETVGLTPIDPYSRPQPTRNDPSICFEKHKGFIDLQHIGSFPRETMPTGTFDFIYDSFGPAFYSEITALLAVEKLLSKRGVFHSIFGGRSLHWNDCPVLEKAVVVLCEASNDYFMLSRNHQTVMRLTQEKFVEVSENVVLAPDISFVLDALTQNAAPDGKRNAPAFERGRAAL